MTSLLKRHGLKSFRYGHLGVYILCSGPDPDGPMPGQRLTLVIYDKANNIVRKLEQVKGDCIDEGYVDFFNSFSCRSSLDEYHMVDTDRNGKLQILATHTSPSDAHSWLQKNVPLWVQEHGIKQ